METTNETTNETNGSDTTETNSTTDQPVNTDALSPEENEPVKYPIVTSEIMPDGSTKTTTEQADGLITWVQTYPDGSKKVTLEDNGYEVTRWKDGSIEYITPRTKRHIKIKQGWAGDVLEARRMQGNRQDEEAFTMASISQLTLFDGAFMAPEAVNKKGYLTFYEYIFLMKYFQEINF